MLVIWIILIFHHGLNHLKELQLIRKNEIIELIRIIENDSLINENDYSKNSNENYWE